MAKRGFDNTMYLYALACVICIACIICITVLSIVVRAQFNPPTPHNIYGYVFNNGTHTAIGGIPVLINNTNASNSVLTYTLSLPPMPPFLGSYSAAINGSDNQTVIALAWNRTHYGRANATLISGTTYINITLNITRPAELNVTIINPINNSLYNITTMLNITANITIIGGQSGIDCNATISFSNEGIFSLIGGDTLKHMLGNIPLGSTITTKWNTTANKTGNSNITITTECLDSMNFDNKNSDTVHNITVQDIYAPLIFLQSPLNNSIFTIVDSTLITFLYNVSDNSDIANCSLIINNAINLTNSTVQKNISQSFTQNLTFGNYTWGINCTDNGTSHISGFSGRYNLTIIPNLPPIVSNINIEPLIDLVPASTKRVTCNATVTDENNITDIKSVNATLYEISMGSNSIDDYNYHYTNNSCSIRSSSTYQNNYTCSFDVYYFANNGSWQCNISATDYSDLKGSLNASTFIPELVAIGISPSVIDYGALEATDTSNDIGINITNIGNSPINVSVEGYGAIGNDGTSMRCTKGNISIGSEKYSTISGIGYSDMTPLTDIQTPIINFTLPQRTSEADYGSDRNQTYWKIMLPAGIKGACNGTVIFTSIIN